MNRKHLAVMVVCTVMAGARVAEALTITVVAPTPTTRIRHNVDVYINAETSFAITTARVTLDGTIMPLTPFASCGTNCVRLFAELSPVSPEGTKLIAVEIADDGGATATTNVPFIFDRPVAVTPAVKPGTVTGTTMRVQGTCDDNGVPCASLDLSFIADPTRVSRTLVDVMAFDEVFDLTPVANRTVLVVAIGHDGFPDGEAVQETGIYVNDSPRLLKIVDTTGAIQDTDLRRVLHVNLYNGSPGPLGVSIFDRTAAMDNQIELLPTPAGGMLTPNGAVWQTADNKTAVYRNGTLEKLPGSGPRVAGTYVEWPEGVTFVVHLLEVVTGATTHVNNAGIALPASNGVLYYLQQSTVDLIRRDGTTETVVGNKLFPLATDGNLVVVCPIGVCGVDVYSSTGAVDHLDTAPCSTLQSIAWVRDGWVVYFEVHSLSVPPYAMYALRSRAPDGTRYLLADNLFGIGFDDVSPSGQVMFHEGGRRFLVSPGGAPVDVASSLGRGLWRDGYWLVAMGDTLFGLDVIPPIPDPPRTCPRMRRRTVPQTRLQVSRRTPRRARPPMRTSRVRAPASVIAVGAAAVRPASLHRHPCSCLASRGCDGSSRASRRDDFSLLTNAAGGYPSTRLSLDPSGRVVVSLNRPLRDGRDEPSPGRALAEVDFA